MNIYKAPIVPKSLQTPEGLADEAWHFANAIAAGRWKYRNVQQVEHSSKIIESVGEGYNLAEYYGEPIFNEIILSFTALKEYVRTKNGYELLPAYEITSTTSQDITKDEIPDHVLEELIEDAEIEGHPLHEILSDPNSQVSDLKLDTFEDFDIERSQEVTYNINHEGEFDDYTMRYFYSINGANTHEAVYSHSLSQIEWMPIIAADGLAIEHRPIVLQALFEANIESDAREIDASYERFLSDKDFSELTEFGAVGKDVHIRQALGMLSMASSGYIDLRKR